VWRADLVNNAVKKAKPFVRLADKQLVVSEVTKNCDVAERLFDAVHCVEQRKRLFETLDGFRKL